jgi:kelch-like protein 10
LSTGEKYDPETDTWTPILDMSMKRSHLSSAVIDDKIFVIGGRVLMYETTSRVE